MEIAPDLQFKHYTVSEAQLPGDALVNLDPATLEEIDICCDLERHVYYTASHASRGGRGAAGVALVRPRGVDDPGSRRGPLASLSGRCRLLGLRYVRHSEEAPLAGHALQRCLTAIFKADPGTGDEIFDGVRHEHLAASARPATRAPMCTAMPPTLPSSSSHSPVQACAYLEPQLADTFADRARTTDRPSRAVEGGEKAVPRCVHLLTSESCELAADRSVVLNEQLPVGAVAELRRTFGGADDVGEEHGCEHPLRHDLAISVHHFLEEAFDLADQLLLIAERRREVLSGQLEETRPWDPAREVAPALQRARRESDIRSDT